MEGGEQSRGAALGIWQGGEGILLWTVSDDAGWLESLTRLRHVHGEIDEVQVLVDTAGLALGDHHAVITIDAPAAANGPVSIPLTLTINRTWVVDQAGGGELHHHPGGSRRCRRL